MKRVIGIGVLLQTPKGTFLFHERDGKAKLNPNKIAPFGGAIDAGEEVRGCAKREMLEELHLNLDDSDLKNIGLFKSHNKPDAFIHLFIAREVDKTKFTLSEGKSIVELLKEEALAHDNVTDFTKEVLNSFFKKSNTS